MASPDTLTLPSGRVLSWVVVEPDLAQQASRVASSVSTIFYFHGLPGSGTEANYFDSSLLQKYSARIIAINRPGMGQSTFDPRRKITDWPNDVLAVADHLGINQFYVWGASGGGPYALVCAHTIPGMDGSDQKDRLLGTAVVAGMWPASDNSQMLRSNRILFWATAWLPQAAVNWMLDASYGKAARNPDHQVLEDVIDTSMNKRMDVERETYTQSRVREVVLSSVRNGMTQGAVGTSYDFTLECADWGFDLEKITAPVQIWHGRLDQNVPIVNAEVAAKKLPNATVHWIDNVAHLSMLAVNLEQILEGLLGTR